MNDVSKQLRTNADFVLGGTGMPPGAAVAGALQMGADEIDRLTRELDEARAMLAKIKAHDESFPANPLEINQWVRKLIDLCGEIGPLPAAPNEAET